MNMFRNRVLYYSVLVVFILGFFACSKVNFSRIDKVITGDVFIQDSAVSIKAIIVDFQREGDCHYGHCWSVNNTPTIEDVKSDLGLVQKQGEYITVLSGLLPNTLYYYRAYIERNGQVTYGDTKTINTSVAIIKINTDGFDFISSNEIKARGSIEGIESINILDYGHALGEGVNAAQADQMTGHGPLSDGCVYTTSLQNLKPGVQYHYRPYAKVSETTIVYGNLISFIIPELVVLTVNNAQIVDNYAVLTGNITSLCIEPVIDYGHCWSVTTSNPNLNANRISLGNRSTTGMFYSSLTNLQPGLTYYYRAYAVYNNKVKYGQIYSFTP